MKLFHSNLSVKEAYHILFYINRKTIELDPKFPYFPDKERTGFFQIYRKDNSHIGGPHEVPDNMKNHKNTNDLILNYFIF